MQRITPFLWYEKDAEKAADFYVSLFDQQFGDSRIVTMTYYDAAGSKASQMPEGSVMTVAFKLAGQEFVAINGGPYFKHSGAVSFVINCETQEQVDFFWENLSSGGGEVGQCGWINHDKFGVTWQVTPTILTKLIADPDKQKAQRVMEAMLKMNKIEIATLLEAAEQK